jgi:hypothetical protein
VKRIVARNCISALCALTGAFGLQAARAEVILGPSQFGADPNPFFRFSGGYNDTPTSTVNNPNFYLSTLDFSGVGWRLPGVFGPGGGSAWNVTMIDNIHFVVASHVVAGNDVVLGDTINFRPAGTSSILTRTVANLQPVPNPDNSKSDVTLGTLNAPFAAGSGIAAYPITPSAAYPQALYVYGRQSEVGQNNFSFTQSGIAFVNNETLNALLFDYDQPNANPDGLPSTVGNNEAYLNAGDSGGPSFVLVGGQFQLVGVHAAVASYEDIGSTRPAGAVDDISYSIDSYMPDYSAQIALMIVPEPSSLALGLFAASGAVSAYRRFRRSSKTA